jgi:MFS family permease
VRRLRRRGRINSFLARKTGSRRMIEHHFLHLHALDGRQLARQFVAGTFVAAHFQQDQSPRRADILVDMVQADARLNLTTILREDLLHVRHFADAIVDVNPKNNVFRGHGTLHGNAPVRRSRAARTVPRVLAGDGTRLSSEPRFVPSSRACATGPPGNAPTGLRSNIYVFAVKLGNILVGGPLTILAGLLASRTGQRPRTPIRGTPIGLVAAEHLQDNLPPLKRTGGLRDGQGRDGSPKIGSKMISLGKDAGTAKTLRLPAMGRALTHRNFRIFVVGQGISVVGTWMQQIATVWLVYRLSHSSMLLGVADFAAQIPAALILPVAGVLTDRWNRHRTVLATQALAMIQAFALMALTATGLISVWQVILLGTLLGLVNAFDATARQSFVIQLVERHEHLANAIAINSSVFNAARLVGPAIAGFVIGTLGECPCFLLNGLSYLAVLGSLLLMRVRPIAKPVADEGIFHGLSEGFQYVTGSMPIRTLLVLLGIVSMMSAPLTMLMPILATEVLHGGPYTLGLLTAAMGVGALAASLFLAARKSVVGLGSVIAVATAVFGMGMTGLSFSHLLSVSLVLLLVTGFAMVAQMAATNALLQTIVEENKRGRVMSFYTLAFFGMGPLGSLLAGCLASTLGATAVFLIFGMVCVTGSLVFAALVPRLQRAVRPIYIRVGILPDVSAEVLAMEPETLPAACRTIPLVTESSAAWTARRAAA